MEPLIGLCRILEAIKILIKDKTICPAVILAANRNDRVIGRTMILVLSIKTRNGFNQSGAPSGRKWAVVFLIFHIKDEMIMDNHNGRPITKVIRRCLERLNVYGIIPRRLTTEIIQNNDVIINVNPFKLVDDVRLNWENITEINGATVPDVRLVHGKNDRFSPVIRTKLQHIIIVIVGINDLYICGSKVEKMSSIIQDSGGS